MRLLGLRGLVCVLYVTLLAVLAHADDFTWTGGGGNTTWSNPANWTNTTPGGTATYPDGDDNVTFNIDATTTNGAAQSLTNSATLSAARGQLTFGPGAITNNGVLTYAAHYLNSDEVVLIDDAVTLDGGGQLILKEAGNSYLRGSDQLLIGSSGTVCPSEQRSMRATLTVTELSTVWIS